jgi:hypothetical protein
MGNSSDARELLCMPNPSRSVLPAFYASIVRGVSGLLRKLRRGPQVMAAANCELPANHKSRARTIEFINRRNIQFLLFIPSIKQPIPAVMAQCGRFENRKVFLDWEQHRAMCLDVAIRCVELRGDRRASPVLQGYSRPPVPQPRGQSRHRRK